MDDRALRKMRFLSALRGAWSTYDLTTAEIAAVIETFRREVGDELFAEAAKAGN
ncbi:MAG: hypothetical protein HQL39_16320 [Alphaproteobacteria bacterium]|nr:hypothetical protein [Alphaproteobacteria bacterium]